MYGHTCISDDDLVTCKIRNTMFIRNVLISANVFISTHRNKCACAYVHVLMYVYAYIGACMYVNASVLNYMYENGYDVMYECYLEFVSGFLTIPSLCVYKFNL